MVDVKFDKIGRKKAQKIVLFFMELMMGLEPMTSALPRMSPINKVCEPRILKT